MPSDKNSNGMVKIIDSSPQRATTGYESHLSATMWYAKLFEILNVHGFSSLHREATYYVGDMHVVKYKKYSAIESDDSSEPNYNLSNSLDHEGYLNRRKMFKRPNDVNTGVSTCRDMFHRKKCLFLSSPKTPCVNMNHTVLTE